jgi:hypothetical protein
MSCVNYADTSDSVGSIHINLRSSGPRYMTSDEEKDAMTYSVTLESPGKKSITDVSDSAVRTLIVPVGIWKITVEAEGNETGVEYRTLKGRGETSVEVLAGKTTPASVKMTATVRRVYNWDQLCTDLADNDLQNLEYIEIANDMTATQTAEPKKDIVLLAEKDVTIKRGAVKTPVFKIDNTVFTLKGKITIDGDKDGAGGESSSALINVQGSGHLKMLEGVTICNNISNRTGKLSGVTIGPGGTFTIEEGSSEGDGGFGGGVSVYDGGIFTMDGGTISGNTAFYFGGGIYIGTKGTFIKTGGTIFGNNSGGDSNQTISTGGGQAAYINGRQINDTLNPGYVWPQQ